MNNSAPTIRELLAHPQVEGLVSQADMEGIAGSLGESEGESKDPIYIRILAGIGAWFAALFLILFLGISGIVVSRSGAIICGIIFLAGAIGIVRVSKATFLSQLSLALAFSGNILVLVGFAMAFEMRDLSTVVIAHAIICAVVYPLYSNSIYRFLAPIALVALATAWIVEEKVFVFMHVLIAAEILLAGILLLGKKRHASLKPLIYSSATMLPATLLFMNLTQAGPWRNDFGEPLWPSNILLVAGLIYLYFHLSGGLKRRREPWLILAILSTILLSIFTTPGILVAICLLVMGYAFGNRTLTALSYLFLPCFLVLFYYAMNIDLAHKSLVVAGSGVVLLVVRWIAGRCKPKEATR